MAYQNHSAKIAANIRPVIGTTDPRGKFLTACDAFEAGNYYGPSHPLYAIQQDIIRLAVTNNYDSDGLFAR